MKRGNLIHLELHTLYYYYYLHTTTYLLHLTTYIILFKGIHIDEIYNHS